MFTTLMTLVAIIAPVPALISSIKQRVTPFRAVLQGLITGAVAALMVMVIGDMAGSNVFDEMFQAINVTIDAMANDPNMKAMLGEGLSTEDVTQTLAEIYSQAIQLLPGTIFVITTVASYIEYIILSKIYKPGGIKAIPMTQLKEFDLPRNIAFVWLALYVLSMLITSTGMIDNNMIFLNINYIFDFAFCIQGFSLILMFAYTKRIPKALAVIAIIVIYCTNLGQTVLMLAGFTDIVFGLKQRMRRVA